jgi:hypothetical protein
MMRQIISLEVEIMRKSRKTQGIKITRVVSEMPMSQEQWKACERLLAKLVARAILAEHKGENLGGEVS